MVAAAELTSVVTILGETETSDSWSSEVTEAIVVEQRGRIREWGTTEGGQRRVLGWFRVECGAGALNSWALRGVLVIVCHDAAIVLPRGHSYGTAVH